MAREADKLRIHLVERHSRFEPAHHRGRGIVCANEKFAARSWRILIIKRRPEFLRRWKFKVGRHHADDRRRFAINSNGLADNVRIGSEIASPDFVTKKRHLLRAGLVVRGGEIPPHHRRHANDLEEIFGHVAAGVALRVIFVAHVDCRPIQIAGHHRERLLRRFQIFVILGRRNLAETKIIVLIGRLGIDQPNADQLLGMRKRKAAQHDRVDHGELRGRAADAKCKNQHRQKTKRFLLEQHAQSDAHILTK